MAPRRTSTRKGWLLAVPLVLAATVALWVALRQPVGVVESSRMAAAAETPAAPLELELAAVRERESVAVEAASAEVAEIAAPTSEPLEDEVLVFEEIGPPPPDPVQLGPASLDLRLVDAATEWRIVSHVELWRLDAPESESWTEGDQLQDQAYVPQEGWVFKDLPEGRYRIVCHAQAWGEEPAEIDVTAPLTRFSLSISLPREFRVHLDVRDRFGVQVSSLFLIHEGKELQDAYEPWRNERSLKPGLSGMSIGRGRFGWGGSKDWLNRGPQPVDGFDLGSFYEANRGDHQRDVLDFETAEGMQVRVRIPPKRDADVYLVAVALSPADVKPLVRVPPGSAAELQVEVIGEAVQRESDLPGAGWERAPVSIRVQAAGCRAAQLTWRVADGELPGIVLEAEP